MGRFTEVHRAAARDGFIDTREAMGRYSIGSSTLHRHLQAIGWTPHLPSLWVPPDAVLPYELRCRLTAEHLGPTALLTAATGLFALGVLRDEPDAVHVLWPGNRWRLPREGICLHYTQDLAAVRWVRWPKSKLPITVAARSLAEHCRHTTFTDACRAAADAIRLRHCGLPQLAAELHARARFPGRALLRQVNHALTGELNHSGYERLGRRLLRARIADVPARPMPVVHRERQIAEVDIPFFDVRYGVEIDGPHHLLASVAAADRARDRVLERDAGWTIDRFFWFELDERPERFVREVAGRLERMRATAR
jgi:hypothetical protein